MSSQLWKFYLEDDAESFRHLLRNAPIAVRPFTHAQKGNSGSQGRDLSSSVGSYGAHAALPNATPRHRTGTSWEAGLDSAHHSRAHPDAGLTRTDINRRDAKGLTILHYAASSHATSAIDFATALIEHPLIDLYVQDLENGWTALHRAFYFGNISIARAIIQRDTQDAMGQHGAVGAQAGTLIKIKDREGNGPYDILTETIKDRTLHHSDHGRLPSRIGDDDDETPRNGIDMDDDGSDQKNLNSLHSVNGDELFCFGSNKNLTLGFRDEDDRQRPERVSLRRPDHLFLRFHREHVEGKVSTFAASNAEYAELLQGQAEGMQALSELPSVIRAKPIVIQDVQMSKFHTAVLTKDPESNLYMCGHGLGGRLGTGDETTQFNFACIEGGALARKRIVAVALGQDHSLAVSDDGDIFSWGSNPFGQLGYTLSKPNSPDQEPVQSLPRQIYGPLKRETLIGVAASRIHSVAYTTTSLYTFGKNEGQLGIVDADARSLDIQVTPRKVAASLFSSPIHSVAAIDRATICLLESHEVWVFANYGWTKPQFPLDGFTNYFLKNSFLATKYDDGPNQICKVTGGGDTICALSSAGEVYTCTVNSSLESACPANASTTNPNKIRGAVTAPQRVWSLKKVRMNARDVAVDQDGSIILSTEAGSVWRRVRRPISKMSNFSNAKDFKAKDYKFSRIPSLTRVTAVRASAFGGYAAIRRDCDVIRAQLATCDSTLWRDFYPLMPFHDLPESSGLIAGNSDSDLSPFGSVVEVLLAQLLRTKDAERDLESILSSKLIDPHETHDMVIGTTVSDLRIPMHQFVFAGRSRVFRELLIDFREEEYKSIPDLLSIHAGDDGRPLVLIQGLDFLTILNLVLYLYTDMFAGFWQHANRLSDLAHRYRQLRVELMKLASRLELRNLESATRRIVSNAERCLDTDFEVAITNSTFFDTCDIELQLADRNVRAHSSLLSRRCPFFQGLFEGRAGGSWLAGRRELVADPSEALSVDLQHIEWNVFQHVLRHLYAGTGVELFDHVVTGEREEFIDLVMEVLSVANELMLDRLSEICQIVLGRHVTVRNACQLLNAIAPCSVTNFKTSCLEYLCLNLETMLESHWLDELDEDVLLELDQVVRENQLAAFPFVKSGAAEELLLERHPELAAAIHRNRQARLDALTLQTKHSHTLPIIGDDGNSNPRPGSSSRKKSKSSKSSRSLVPPLSPTIKHQRSAADLMFNMDEVEDLNYGAQTPSSQGTPIIPPTPDTALSPELQALGSHRASFASPTQAMRGGSVAGSFDPSSIGAPAVPVTEPITPTRSNAAPWGASPLTSGKLGLKDIMAQTSQSRVSTISLGLSPQSPARREDRAIGSFAERVSQKERKKQQQQHQQQQQHLQQEKNEKSLPSPHAAAVKSSPWNLVSPVQKRSLKADTQQGQEITSQSAHKNTQPQASRSVTTPQLTMRQTVANAGSKSKQSGPPTQRSVSSPQVPRPTSSSKASQTPPSGTLHASDGPGMTADMMKSIPIQSIRHSPRPGADASSAFTSSSADQKQHSLATILSQQEAEKIVRKDAANTKRSLMEIQQEQEFQEWWDAESRRVMAAEAAQATRSSRGPKRGNRTKPSASSSSDQATKSSKSTNGRQGADHNGANTGSTRAVSNNKKGSAISADPEAATNRTSGPVNSRSQHAKS